MSYDDSNKEFEIEISGDKDFEEYDDDKQYDRHVRSQQKEKLQKRRKKTAAIKGY